MMKFAVFLPVGPSEDEVKRAGDTIESLFSHEPSVSWCVFVDDSLEDRKLTKIFPFPDTCQAVSLLNPRRLSGIGYLGGLCAGILSALLWIQKNTDASFVLRLHTDALVIAPFAGKIRRAFDAMPWVGMVGSYDRTCNGEKRDFSVWANTMQKLSLPISFWSKPGKPGEYVRLALWGNPAAIRRHIKTALHQGYIPGEHCLGGAGAISREMIDRMEARGYLNNPLAWLYTRCNEDVMLGMYTRAVGMKNDSLAGNREVFGLKSRGLPDSPQRLVMSGYSFIHSVKNDQRFSETDIRNFFRQRRVGGGGAKVTYPARPRGNA